MDPVMLSTLRPSVTGLSPEVWTWLRESLPVRPGVVATVRERLAAGDRPPAEDVALAILLGAPRP
jgi:hypothetical protein